MTNQFARKLFRSRSAKTKDLRIYREQVAAFRKKFGREMGPHDPFFFDPDADTPQFLSPKYGDQALNLLAALMAEAGTDPATIYAFKRTGGLFPSPNLPLSEEDLLDWNAAVYEYQQKLDKTPRQ